MADTTYTNSISTPQEPLSVQIVRAIADYRDAEVRALLNKLDRPALLEVADDLGYAVDCVQRRLGRSAVIAANTVIAPQPKK